MTNKFWAIAEKMQIIFGGSLFAAHCRFRNINDARNTDIKNCIVSLSNTRSLCVHDVNRCECKTGAEQAVIPRDTLARPRAVSVDLQLRLESGWGPQNHRSVPPYGPLWLVKDLSFSFSAQYIRLYGYACLEYHLPITIVMLSDVNFRYLTSCM